jgi:CDP-glucose 4,6-dehydratase
VEWIVNELTKLWGNGARWEEQTSAQPHEGKNLRLDWSKAASRLRWNPELRLSDALAMTVAWYRAKSQGKEMHAFTMGQIEQYENRLLADRQLVSTDSEVRV